MNYLKYLRNYKLESVLAPLFKLLEAGFELFVPLVVARMIDVGITGKSQTVILQSGLLLVGLAVIGMISATTAQYYSAKIAAGFGTGLRNDLFSHVVNLSHKEIETIGRDQLITRITSDTNQMQTGVNLFFRLVLRSPFIVFGAMIMAFFIDMRQSVIFLITIALLYVIVTLISRKTVVLFKRVQTVLDQITGQTLENLTGVRVIRAFNKQTLQREKFDKSISSLYSEQMRAASLASIINPVTLVVINLAVVVILKTGAAQVNVGDLTQGQVVALVNYMLQILVELVKMANLITTLSKSVASGKRLDQIFVIQNSMKNGSIDAVEYFTNHAMDIAFERVGFAYPSAKGEAIEDITFCADEGSFVGIIGGTGSGKSTLINLIPRFFDTSSGEIRLGGKNIQEFDMHSLRKLISLAEQKSRLFKGTIESNLSFGLEDATKENMVDETKSSKLQSSTDMDARRMEEAIRMAQASDVVEKKSDFGGLLANVSQMGANFSGGQRQRLSLARAMLKRAKILILDDVSSALDFLTDAALRKTLREEFSDRTIFLVSQRISSIRHSDQILVLDAGRIAGIGTHEELKRSCEVYREICQSQLEESE